MKLKAFSAALLLGSAAVANPAVTMASETEVATELPARDGAHGFDFLHGRWQVHNKRLREFLADADTWDEFEATAESVPILGGMGNIEHFVTPSRPGFVGMSLRLYDPAAKQWSIYWVDNRSGQLQPPVVGQLSGSRAVFEGDDVFAGEPIRVRYIWSGMDIAEPRWQQAFSRDGGTNWETNWIMDFRRAERVAGEH